MTGRPRRRAARAAGTAARAWPLVVLALCARPAPAQRPVPELRVDGALGRDSWAQVGAGLFADAGLYARVGLVAGIGAGGVGRREGGTGPVARVEALGRFHLDPQRTAGRGVYAGGGIGLSWLGRSTRWGVVALVGVEGPRRGGRALALEAGLGGGVRLGVAVRAARADRR